MHTGSTESSPADRPDSARPERHASRTAVVLVVLACVGFLGVNAGVAWHQIGHSVGVRANWLAEALRPAADGQGDWATLAQPLLDAAGSGEPADEARQLLDAAGRVVVESGPADARWSLTRSASVMAGSNVVGEVRVHRSIVPWLRQRAIDAGLASLFGFGVHLAMRRYLDLADRRRRERVARALDIVRSETADMFQVLFDRSDYGLLICAADGRVLDCNPAATRMFAAPAARVVGSEVSAWIVTGMAPSAGAFPVAAGEWHGRRDGQPAGFAVQVEVHRTLQRGERRHVVVVHDLTVERQTQERLAYLANYDSLTGLPNRALFRDRLAQAMERSRRSGQPMALLFLDLDRFKVVNDSLGHEVGDRLLRHVAETLTHSLRHGDSVGRGVGGPEPFTLSRLGGDEFTVIAEGIGGAEDAALIARRLLDALSVPFVVGDEELHVSASIGISMYPMDDVDLDGMVRHTDMAMYRSKSLGRNTYSFFSDDLNAAVSARLSLEGNLRRALERKEFVLYFQPKADLRTGCVTGVEALLRWHAPGRGMVPPDRFIAVLEDTGLIVPVGAWVIRAACKQLAEWDKAGLPPISMAVNLSARQLRHPYLLALVGDTLRETGIEPARLELELTESLLMEDTETNRGVLAGFARLGVRLAIDDFGTGHSSLSYLRRLDVDTLKIDRSFVTAIPSDPEDCAIATAVLALGQSLQMKVVAEGVETEEQAEFLRNLGCSEMQGWLLSRALPAAQMATWLAERDADYRARTSPRPFGADDGDALPNINIWRETVAG